MSKHNKHQSPVVPTVPAGTQTPPAPVLETLEIVRTPPAPIPQQEGGDNEPLAALAVAVEAPPKEDEQMTLLEKLVGQANLTPELKAKVMKLVEQEKRSAEAITFSAFDKAMKDKEKGIVQYLTDLAKAHKVDLSGRKISVVFPKAGEAGDPSYLNVPKGKGGGGSGNGTGKGFQSHGKVVAEGQEHSSLHAFCLANAIQYEGRRTAWEAVEDPLELGTKKALPFKYQVENNNGKIILTKVAR